MNSQGVGRRLPIIRGRWRDEGTCFYGEIRGSIWGREMRVLCFGGRAEAGDVIPDFPANITRDSAIHRSFRSGERERVAFGGSLRSCPLAHARNYNVRSTLHVRVVRNVGADLSREKNVRRDQVAG